MIKHIPVHEGLAAIVRASAASKLQILEANGCGISPEGARLLGEALPSSPILTLKLRDNSIGDEVRGRVQMLTWTSFPGKRPSRTLS